MRKHRRMSLTGNQSLNKIVKYVMILIVFLLLLKFSYVNLFFLGLSFEVLIFFALLFCVICESVIQIIATANMSMLCVQ